MVQTSYQRIGPLLAKQKTRLVFSNWGDVDVKKVVVKEIPRNASEAQIDLSTGQDPDYDEYLEAFGNIRQNQNSITRPRLHRVSKREVGCFLKPTLQALFDEYCRVVCRKVWRIDTK